MWKSYQAHYKNKYPGCEIKFSGDSFDVYSNGYHLVSLVKDGAGGIKDVSEEHSCWEKHDLSPIPKEARMYKFYEDGKVAPAEEYEERKKWVKENACQAGDTQTERYKYICSEKEQNIKDGLKLAKAKKEYLAR